MSDGSEELCGLINAELCFPHARCLTAPVTLTDPHCSLMSKHFKHAPVLLQVQQRALFDVALRSFWSFVKSASWQPQRELTHTNFPSTLD